MMDREKVIQDLEKCLDDSIAAVVPADTVRDAIALLKAQPRVLTLEEVRNLQNDPPVALVVEERVPIGTWDGGSVCKWCGSLFIREEYLDDNVYVNASTYEKIWRVWTAWPSDEQMEAKPWERLN